MKERLKQLLAIPGESRFIEFKRLGETGSSPNKKILQSIVAMANTDGGILVLGIDDPEKGSKIPDNRIYGIEESLERYDEIGREIENIKPPIPGLWSNQDIIPFNDTKRIAVIHIPKSMEKFSEN
ncbi:MAG: ATP-binding protein [Candidatus Marinimicrobia bacterium]|nr:ATP-binding protein [Candidatus Neomarinimicrobiota bacterium]